MPKTLDDASEMKNKMHADAGRSYFEKMCREAGVDPAKQTASPALIKLLREQATARVDPEGKT